MTRPTRYVLSLLGVITLAGMLPALTGGAAARTVTLVANANLNGTWAIYQGGIPVNGSFVITGENQTTGTFGGRVNLRPGAEVAYYEITSGKVKGNAFTIVATSPGTVVGKNGVQATYAGLLSGGQMRGTQVDFRGWRNGRPADIDATGNQSFTAVRDQLTVSGKITLGCESGANACPVNGLPFEGFKVEVTGDNGSASSISDDNGKWNVDLPAGNYTVTPTDDDYTFTPSHIDINVTKSLVSQDFKACAADVGGGPSANYRLRPNTAYSLSGSTCNTDFTLDYTSSGTPVSMQWTSKASSCDKNQYLKRRKPLQVFAATGGRSVLTVVFGGRLGSSLQIDAKHATANITVNTAIGAGGAPLWAVKAVAFLNGSKAAAAVNGAGFADQTVGSAHCQPVSEIVQLRPGGSI